MIAEQLQRRGVDAVAVTNDRRHLLGQDDDVVLRDATAEQRVVVTASGGSQCRSGLGGGPRPLPFPSRIPRSTARRRSRTSRSHPSTRDQEADDRPFQDPIQQLHHDDDSPSHLGRVAEAGPHHAPREVVPSTTASGGVHRGEGHDLAYGATDAFRGQPTGDPTVRAASSRTTWTMRSASAAVVRQFTIAGRKAIFPP